MDTPVGEQSARIRSMRIGAAVWTVYEHTPGYDRRSRPTLVFESQDVVRRTRVFPPEWFALPDEELYALSWGR